MGSEPLAEGGGAPKAAASRLDPLGGTDELMTRTEAAIADLRAGKMVILVDDEDRENEGDLCMAAETVTPEAINFMAKHGRGLICLALTPERAGELNLNMMVPEQHNQTHYGTACTV